MIEQKKFKNKETGEIVTEFRITDIQNFEEFKETHIQEILREGWDEPDTEVQYDAVVEALRQFVMLDEKEFRIELLMNIRDLILDYEKDHEDEDSL